MTFKDVTKLKYLYCFILSSRIYLTCLVVTTLMSQFLTAGTSSATVLQNLFQGCLGRLYPEITKKCLSIGLLPSIQCTGRKALCIRVVRLSVRASDRRRSPTSLPMTSILTLQLGMFSVYDVLGPFSCREKEL